MPMVVWRHQCPYLAVPCQPRGIMNNMGTIIAVVRIDGCIPIIPRIRSNGMKQKRDDLLLPIPELDPQTTTVRGDLRVLGIGSREGLTQWFVVSFHVWPSGCRSVAGNATR